MSAAVSVPAGLEGVYGAVLRALGRVEAAFDAQLKSDLPPVQRLVRHIEAYRGKMLRPQLVCLCGIAAACARGATHGGGNGHGGNVAGLDGTEYDGLVTARHITVATVCEMVHMATLVHDDVLDEADIRRKGQTVNRLRGNEIAVILGDYLFSSAYHLCSTLDSQAAALLIGACGMTLCTGELLQLHHRENFSIDEPTYFEIVERKTGSLIAVSCQLGAMQSGGSAGAAADDLAEKFRLFGLKLGVAFQIQDDLLDLTGDAAVVGKPLLRDLALGKLTLPVIHHLATASAEARGESLALLKAAGDADVESLRRLVQGLNRTGSIEHARTRAKALVEEAKALLGGLPESAPKSLLMLVADQVVARAV